MGPELDPKTMSMETFDKLSIPTQLKMFSGLPLFQQLKIWAVSIAGLSVDSIHVYIGVGCLLVSMLLYRKRSHAWIMLLPGLVTSLVIEGLALYHDSNHLGFFQWMDSTRDVINMNLVPVMVMTIVRLHYYRANAKPTVR